MSVDYTTGEITSVSLGPLAVSLAKAQMAFPKITRSKTVRVTTKTGGSYTFDYAPLETILDAVRKPLADNGLVIAQLIDRDELVSLLLHESGAKLEGRASLPNASSGVQEYGSAITYIRRYAIQALLGIAAEEDDDGNTAAGNHAAPAKATPRATETPVAPRNGQKPSTDTPDLTEDDWAGLFTDAPAAKPTPVSGGPGLSFKAFSAKLAETDIDLRAAGDKAKQLFGASKWSIKELTDAERAQLLFELVGVAA